MNIRSLSLLATAIIIISAVSYFNKLSEQKKQYREWSQTVESLKGFNIHAPAFSQQLEQFKNQIHETTDPASDKILWIKVAFSALFALAALYIILFGKYDDETRKWAFNILALIAGVWIGTATA